MATSIHKIYSSTIVFHPLVLLTNINIPRLAFRLTSLLSYVISLINLGLLWHEKDTVNSSETIKMELIR